MNLIEEEYTPEEMAEIKTQSAELNRTRAERTTEALNFHKKCFCGEDKGAGATFCATCWEAIPSDRRIYINIRWDDLVRELEEARQDIESEATV